MQRETVGTSRMKAPDDGIVSSHRPRGWLARSWLSLVEVMGRTSNVASATQLRANESRADDSGVDAGRRSEARRTANESRGSESPRIGGLEFRTGRPLDGEDRIARGRSWARTGRVRDLWFSPGSANAEVVAPEPQQVSIRVRVLDESEWERAIGVLAANLQHIAALVEGELPQAVLDAFNAAGLPLLPTVEELEGACSCDDFALPCAHVAAVHHVLADALDGEPFLLLTLRGRPRDQVLAALRRSWGDPEPLRAWLDTSDEDPPAGDWFETPAPLPAMVFSFLEPSDTSAPAAGLLELGPPPGDGELERALRPLYEGGAKNALELALREETQPERRRMRRRRARSSPGGNIEESTARQLDERLLAAGTGSEKEEKDDMESTDQAAADTDNRAPTNGAATAATGTLTERLVDELARVESAKSKELARSLGAEMLDVRNELLELEKMGIVYRTGQTRGTRWWLG